MVSDCPVGRTVYLPPDLAEKLRVHAFRNNLSQNDVMVAAVRAALVEPIKSEEHPCVWDCRLGCVSATYNGYGDPRCLNEQERKAAR